VKIIEYLKTKNFFEKNRTIKNVETCSVVSNSNVLLEKEHRIKIDANEIVMRFNMAKTEGFEKHVGTRTNIRVLNCHSILNLAKEDYFLQQKERFPNIERDYLYTLSNQTIIFKTDPSWRLDLVYEDIIKKVEENKNKVLFVNQEFYSVCKKLNKGYEPSNGLAGILLAISLSQKIDCFGFTFYGDNRTQDHYYEKIVRCNGYDPKQSHDFAHEKYLFNLFKQAGIIQAY